MALLHNLTVNVSECRTDKIEWKNVSFGNNVMEYVKPGE